MIFNLMYHIFDNIINERENLKFKFNFLKILVKSDF